MESLLFMLNSIVMVFVIFMSLRDERRDPDEPQTGFFRMMLPTAPDTAPAQPDTPVAPPDWADWSSPPGRGGAAR